MRKIGFKNFRKFKELEPINYSGITFLVGKNNSGKSTVVKAILLVDHFFKSFDYRMLSFEEIENLDIETYDQAIFKNSKDDFFELNEQFEHFKISITINKSTNKYNGEISSFIIKDLSQGKVFHFDILNEKLCVTFWALKNELSECEYVEICSIKYALNVFHSINHRMTEPESLFKAESEKPIYKLLNNCFRQTIKFTPFFSKIFTEGQRKSVKNSIKKSQPSELVNLLWHFREKYNIEYIGAILVKQPRIFVRPNNLSHKNNNDLSKTIHNFYILDNNNQHDFSKKINTFINEWIVKFKIGISFDIILSSNDVYEFLINTNYGPIHLKDLGMGSVKIIEILLKIGCILFTKLEYIGARVVGKISLEKHVTKPKMVLFDKYRNTIIIEEPEICLHPAHQSKLADLFFDAYQKFGVNFLIETHSEYIIRRTQVLVAENDLEGEKNSNPFCVHYFPSEEGQQPYQMKYKKDGSFENNFGKGFFDEASAHTLKLIKLKRSKEA